MPSIAGVTRRAGGKGGGDDRVDCVFAPVVVPAGQIFVMGDNRTFSSDSRTFGPVPVGNIIGKVILRFWPFDRAVFFEW